MWQPNVPRKTVSLVSVWVSVLLILVSVIMSFTPMMTLKTGDKVQAINEIVEKISGEETLDIPEEVEVSMPQLLGSVKVVFSMVGVAMDAAKDAQNGGDVSQAGEDLKALFETPEGKETIIMTAAFVSTILDGFDFSTESGMGMFLNLIITVIALLYVLIFTFIVPFVYVIVALVAIVRALSSVKEPEKVVGKVGSTLPSMIALPLIYLMFQSFIPGMAYASGSLMLWILAFAGVICSALVARLRKYDDKDFKYSLILQGTSILALVGYIIFFFNAIKTNLIQNFLMGGWSEVMAGIAAAEALNQTVEVGSAHIVYAILILVAFFSIILSIGYFTKSASRLACSVKRQGKFGSVNDNAIVTSIFMILVFVLAKVVMGGVHDYTDLSAFLSSNPNVTDASQVTFLTLNASETAALNGVLVGGIIAFVSELALIILKKVFCAGMSEDQMIDVMTGKAKTPEEKLAEAEKVLQEAKAQVAASEQTAE